MPKATKEAPEETPEVEDGAAEIAEEAPAKKSSRGMLIMMVVLLVPAIVGGYLAYSHFGQITEAVASTGAGSAEANSRDSVTTYGQFASINELLVNPKNSGGKRFLVVSLGVETKSTAVIGELEQKDVVVRDAILQLLSERTSDELAAIERRDSLKQQIIFRLNGILQEGDIDRLYFTQYLLQ